MKIYKVHKHSFKKLDLDEDDEPNNQDKIGDLDESPDPEGPQDEALTDDVPPIENNDNLKDKSQFGTQGSTSQVEYNEEEMHQNDDSRPNNETLENTDEDLGDQPHSGKRSSDEKVSKNAESSQSEPNPRRSLGEAIKSWMKRLRNVSEATPDSEQERENNGQEFDEGLEYEFLEADDQAADTEALDIATQEQLDAMDGKAIADLDMQQTYADMQPEKEKGSLDDDDTKPESLRKEAGELNDGKQESAETENSGDLENSTGDFGKNLDSLDGKEGGEFDAMNVEPKTSEELSDIIDSDQHTYEELRHKLEMELAEWRKTGQELSEAQKIWKECVVLTRNLSYSLCEKLRLILEPTLAAKLKGDYRTGKRLNMRKIIPYIASQFKKDKIWLRRTQPSKRTYQIMIAVDDSKSMEESQCIQLAYESLAMITSSLTQLEAGDLSILSFGENIKLLHPFHLPFSEESGAQVIQKFGFNQDRTNVRSLIGNSFSILEEARRFAEYSPNQSELWQLELIISDGICEDHDQIRALVRKAAEKRIMMVFLILDNRPGTTSITNLTNVVYKNDPETQKSSLHMTQYMDTFPFDYFVLVKDIKTLPQVLSDTLCQYFAFTSSD
jgi:midasin (ATPase involved in ribosome maturation)